MGHKRQIAGLRILITGASQGIGRALALEAARRGARVLAAARSTDLLGELARESRAAGHPLETVVADVTSPEDRQKMLDASLEQLGGLDVLVNNAAIDMVKRLDATTLDEWNRIVGINQTGVFLGMRTAAIAMQAVGRGGSIVNISSVAGLEGVKGHGAYTGTKWAVRGLTKVGAQEWGRYGIRVNSVHPGVIETPMTAGTPVIDDPDVRRKLERNIPIGRVGQPVDIANMVLFLASDESSYCTGQEFTVDGGIHH